MVNFWIFPSNSISDSVGRGVKGTWILARQTVERSDIKIKKGDKVILYQPAEIREEPQKAGYYYIGNFSIDSEPFIENRGDTAYVMKIRDFNLWKKFVAKSEEEKLDTDIPRGSEFGRLIKTQVVMLIKREDYEKIAELYGKKVEESEFSET